MSDNLKRQPKKGILKNSSSFESEERQRELSKGTKWDEMNILATHHPKDKDYGHMKIEEPKTPFSYETVDSGDEIDGIDADLLAQKIKLGGNEKPKALHDSDEDSSEEEEEVGEESPEEKAKRQAFEMKRKHHYNEFAAVKLARKLMEEDDDEAVSADRIEEEEEEEDGQPECLSKEGSNICDSESVDNKNSG